MQVIIFLFYFLLACYGLELYRLRRGTGLSRTETVFLFGLKVFSGCLNLFFHRKQYVTNDVDSFYYQSLKGLELLQVSAVDFFNHWLFYWEDIHHHINFLKPENGIYWSNLGNVFHVKFMTLANLLSLGHVYTNVIIFNVVFFICQLLLFRALCHWQPEKRVLLLLSIFLIPSVLFWCSGMHKDGWILSAYCLIFYGIISFEQSKRPKFFIWILVGMVLLLVVRYFYFIILLIPYSVYLVATRFRLNGFKAYTVGMLFLFTLFFTTRYIHPDLNFMKMVSHKQKHFFMLKGYSDMKTPIIEDNIWSYIKNAPTALNHILLRPYLWENPSWKYILSALDSLFIFLSMIILFRYAGRKGIAAPAACFMLTVGMLGYLFIGYTIPNAGALLRYKSEFSVLMLTSLVLISELDVAKIRQLFGFK